MKPTKLIGLAGSISSGKSTVAKIMVETYGYVELSYGKYIRQEVAGDPIPQGWIPNDIRKTLEMLRQRAGASELVWVKPTTPEVRKALQWWGHMRFSQHANYWQGQLSAELAKMDQGKGRVVISDVRRPIEYYWVNHMGGENWKVDRIVKGDEEARKHEVENHLQHYVFDSEIDNNQDLVRLSHCVKHCLSCYDPEAVK